MNAITNYFQNIIANSFCPTNQEPDNKDFLNFLQVYFVLSVGLMSVNAANYSLNYFSKLCSFKILIFKAKPDVPELELIPTLDSDSDSEDSSSDDEELVTENAYGELLNKLAN